LGIIAGLVKIKMPKVPKKMHWVYLCICNMS